MINIVKYRYWFFIFSLLILIPGTVYLALYGLQRGIDFTGGTLWQVTFQRPVSAERVRQVLAQNGLRNVPVQSSGLAAGGSTNTPTISMRLPEVREGSPEKQRLEGALRREFGQFREDNFTTVGPAVGNEIQNRSVLAVALTSLGILLYMAFAFRKVNHPFRYGACAIIAMLHDPLIVLGIYAILGRHFGIEVDALFITALLTVIGFSVHDTIVVFDRIRENVHRFHGESFARIANFSVNQTLDRSINTGLATIFTLTALLLMGGGTIRNFVLVLLIGIISGTYSSIFNATCLLVVWENGDLGRLWQRLTGRRPAVPLAAGA